MNRKKQKNVKNKKQCTDANQNNSSVTTGVLTRSMTRTKFSQLNDDCILEIFSYLSKRELMRIERVCKKWKELASQVWAKETILNVEKIWQLAESKKQSHLKRMGFTGPNLQRLENVLKKCGQFVTCFDLSCGDDEDFWSHKCDPNEIVRLLCHYCKNLKEIILHCGRLSEEGLKALEENIVTENLETLDLDRCCSIGNEQLKRILEKGRNINKLIINLDSDVTGQCLADSNRVFQKLGVNGYFNKITVEHLEKVLENSPELQYFQGPGYYTFNMLNGMPLQKHLTHLIIHSGCFFKDFPESPLSFPNLCFLELNGDQSIENNILSEFHKIFPNLESVDLSECEYKSKGENDPNVFNNDGIKELGKLSKLKNLKLNSVWCLKADTLIDIAIKTGGKIESMRCYWCNKLRDSGMIKFVSLCPNLTYLDVSYGQRITDYFLDQVLDLLPLRTSKKPLKIRITHSNNCNLNNYEKKYPMLEIEEHGELDAAHFDYDESEYEEDGYEYYSDEDDSEGEDEGGIQFYY